VNVALLGFHIAGLSTLNSIPFTCRMLIRELFPEIEELETEKFKKLPQFTPF
jgi:hypothetical protein